MSLAGTEELIAEYGGGVSPEEASRSIVDVGFAVTEAYDGGSLSP